MYGASQGKDDRIIEGGVLIQMYEGRGHGATRMTHQRTIRVQKNPYICWVRQYFDVAVTSRKKGGRHLLGRGESLPTVMCEPITLSEVGGGKKFVKGGRGTKAWRKPMKRLVP